MRVAKLIKNYITGIIKSGVIQYLVSRSIRNNAREEALTATGAGTGVGAGAGVGAASGVVNGGRGYISNVKLLFKAIGEGSSGLLFLILIRLLLHPASNVIDQEGNTFLSIAIYRRSLNMATLLLNLGTDVNKCSGRYTPLLEAAIERDINMATLLLDRGAKINQEPFDVYSPFYRALKQADMNMLNLFCAHGANVNQLSSERISPLGFAIRSERVDLIEFLLKKGADFNQTCRSGQSLLQLASSTLNQDVVDLMLGVSRWSEARDSWVSAVVRSSNNSRGVSSL